MRYSLHVYRSATESLGTTAISLIAGLMGCAAPTLARRARSPPLATPRERTPAMRRTYTRESLSQK